MSERNRYQVPANEPECPNARPNPGTHCSCWSQNFTSLVTKRAGQCCWCKEIKGEK